MRCPNCHEEVLLAEVCPYCGRPVPQDYSEQKNEEIEETSGTFVGPMESVASDQDRQRSYSEPRYGRKGQPAKPGFFSFLRYFFDPQVPVGRKLLMVGMFLYILSPVDFVPELLPIFGWMDDIAVGTLLWTFINYELAKYRGPKV
ncbi:MAG: DUF1232 domain-containing protein [Firmicutes bacterium]|nr:DUF1232 domain-containing protein [Bacillota bacterium]